MYKVQDGLDLARKLGKGVPFTGVDVSICDIVSSTIYRAYPWRDTLKTTPDNWSEIPITDGNQDYATGLTDIFRMTQFWLRRTDVSPQQVRNITVSKNVTLDPVPKAPDMIRAASYQAGVNKFRLESAVRIPTGATYLLGGEYQPQHSQITDLQDPLWLEDQDLEVFAKGLIYWAYRLADDSRAGAAQFQEGRLPVYTGALAEFMSAINAMAQQEDFGNIDGYYPSDSMGVDGRRWYSNDLAPYFLV